MKGSWIRLVSVVPPVSSDVNQPSLSTQGFPGGSAGKESACNAGDPGSGPGLGRSAGEGDGYPLQYSGLEDPADRGAWRGAVRGVANSGTRPSDVHVHFAFLSTQKQGRGWLGDDAARVGEALPPSAPAPL